MNAITITKSDLIDLKTHYQQAIDDSQEQFTWQDNELLTSYAKYLIEYLNNKYGIN